MLLVLSLLFPLQAATTPAAAMDASHLVVSPGRTIVELDAGRLKGEPWRLAWSDGGKDIYLQVVQRDRSGRPTDTHHFVIRLDSAHVSGTDGEPAWAAAYWSWKSAQAPPGAPGQRIEVEQRAETARATTAPMGGDLARGGTPDAMTGTTADEAAGVAYQSQAVNVFALRWHGALIGEWRNSPVVPGLTFGWAPGNHVALAFANRDGRLFVLDSHGAEQAVPDAKHALLPAWSNDGSRLAYLQRRDAKHFVLSVADISTR